MKFTLGWLKDHLETSAPLNEITDTLTAIGLELESIQDRAKVFAPFTVAHVEKAEKHPDADRLKVCIVDTGKEKVQVVCGAPNARTGMKVIFAPPGSYIPGTDMVLKKGSIRGQESNGMLVSEREMGLPDNHEGIIDLPADTKVGTPFAQIYGLDDPVIDVAITPNRADCTGIHGIARDLAAAGLGTLKPLKTQPVKGTFKSPVGVDLKFSGEDKKACPLFVGRYIKGVKNGSSPEWMQRRLKAIGLRPISALVDITNYLTYDVCRPLHVFDADKLKGGIHVRFAKKGETLEALDGKTYTLEPAMTAVCDDSGVLGLGGIVGGSPTGCTEGTVNVFVESAYFDPTRTARTGRSLQIESDARYRFERGIDPAFTLEGMELVTRLIQEICGGEASEIVKAGEIPEWKRTVPFDPAYVKKLAGFEIPEATQRKILSSLGFATGEKTVQPPSWRADIEGKADLVEEVTRINGFDKIPSVSVRSPSATTRSAETASLSRARMARTALAARGMNECVTWSFMPHAVANLFSPNDNQSSALTLCNPISTDLDRMRPTAIPNLIQAAGKNADKGFLNTALFEVGPVFCSPKVDGQTLVAAGVRRGAKGPRHWSGVQASRDVDPLDAKADVFAVLESCGLSAQSMQVTRDAPGHYHPGRAGALRIGQTLLACFGDIHPAILEEMDVKGPLCGFEVFINAIPEPKRKGTAKSLLALSPFQPLQRDFSFIVDENVEADALIRAAKGVDRELVAGVDVFDVYQGKGVDAGKKSIAITVTLQPKDHTLTDAEIEGLSKKIVDAIATKTGGSLRT